MSIEQALHSRSGSQCELCKSNLDLTVYEVLPLQGHGEEHALLICPACRQQFDDSDQIEPHHWHCLADTMWTPVPAVQVMAWRMLKQLPDESWALDLLEQLYLDDETLAWAESGLAAANDEEDVIHRDSNGVQLTAGDNVTLIKDLPVKGAGFTAKRGTVVRGISLVSDNPEHIEGRVNGQKIVILTKFVKR